MFHYVSKNSKDVHQSSLIPNDERYQLDATIMIYYHK